MMAASWSATPPPAKPAPPGVRVPAAIAQDIQRLRGLPACVRQAVRMIDDPEVDLRSLSRVLATDQVVSAQILRYANSAAVGGAAACRTIPEGILRIGIRQLKSVLYAAAVAGPLTARLAGYQYDRGDLYRHSAAVADTARFLALHVGYGDPEEAYAAGLLHDIGKLVLDRHMRQHFDQMVAEVKETGKSPLELEERYLGIDHAAAGGLIAENWNYPPALIDAIRCHHTPGLASHRPVLAAIVHLANILILQSDIGLTALGIPPLSEEAVRVLRLAETDLGNIALEMRRHIQAFDREFRATYTGMLRERATR